MASDFGGHMFTDSRYPTGALAREWLTSWGEVHRGDSPPKPDPAEHGRRTSKLLRPQGLSMSHCMALDVEVTIGPKPIIRHILTWRYIHDLELRDLQAEGDILRLLSDTGMMPVTYWRLAHEEFCRRLVRERGLHRDGRFADLVRKRKEARRAV